MRRCADATSHPLATLEEFGGTSRERAGWVVVRTAGTRMTRGDARVRRWRRSFAAVSLLVATSAAGCGTVEATSDAAPADSSSTDVTAASPGSATGDASTTPTTTTATPTPTPTRPGPGFGTPLNPVRFAAAMQQVDSVILDVRTPAEFAQGHLPGAINHDLSTRFRQRVAPLDREDAYAVYCGSSACALQAVGLMKELGFVQAYYLDGGFVAWQRAGGQVTR